ncbi:MAG: hypothetical protein AAF567_13865 [Actinomycetota bacterium]
MLAAVGDTPYNIVRLIHLLSVIVGTGLAFVAPLMAARARRLGVGSDEAAKLVDDAASELIFPSLLVAGTAGGALVGFSDDFWDFQQTWLAIGGAIWMLTLGASALVYPPRWLRLVTLSDSQKRALVGVLHLSLAVMLVLMVWKPGALPGAY